MSAMKSLQTQVGGSHYKDMAIQPMEYILANDLPFIEGAIIKYVSRWRNKGGIADLDKARHLIMILVDYEEAKQASNTPQEAQVAPPAALSGTAILESFAARLPGPAPSEAIRERDPAFEHLPETFRPRALAMPASKTDANGDTNMDRYHPVEGDEILIYKEGVWCWRTIRMISKTMDGTSYNVPEVPGQSSILMVPHKHIFAIRTNEGMFIV